MGSEMMSTREIAEYLSINEKLVYRLAKERKIPGTRVTGKWIFPRRLVDEWIRSNAQETIDRRTRMQLLQNHVVVIGSNDFSVEFLSHELNKEFPAFSLSFSNVGSMGGLIALGGGCGHAAGAHLLDPVTGDYNLPHIARYLPDVRVTVINLVYRDIGFIVKAGNPLNVHTVEDLQRSEVAFINRQEGSGTRILLDIELRRRGIDPATISGYDRIVSTHLEVGIAVLSGSATVGLGIFAAARMLGLDFVHVAKERYDLIIRREYMDSPPVKALVKVVRSDSFKQNIADMGGYDTRDTGRVLADW